MTKLLPALALLAAAPAGAATFTYTPGGNGPVAPGFTLVDDFNAGTTLGTQGVSYYTQSVSGEGAMPMGSDGSRFVAIKANGTGTATLAAGVRRFSLYIGSIDASNSITFNYADGSSDSLLGAALTRTPDGSWTSAQSNGLFTFTGTDRKAIRSLTFGSGQNSFEFDDLATSTAAVPEPASWALMILGFGLVGQAARRRRMAPACAAA